MAKVWNQEYFELSFALNAFYAVVLGTCNVWSCFSQNLMFIAEYCFVGVGSDWESDLDPLIASGELPSQNISMKWMFVYSSFQMAYSLSVMTLASLTSSQTNKKQPLLNANYWPNDGHVHIAWDSPLILEWWCHFAEHFSLKINL